MRTSIMNLDDIRASDKEIVVVDDAAASLKLLTDILSGAGYRVRPAIDGTLALRSVQAKKPALILLDIKMPGMDGYEVCRRLKADESTRSIPIIFISVLEDERDKLKGFEAGGVDYINKPFHSQEVLARVKTHLSLSIVQERLAAQNERLSMEIAERIQAEEALRKARDELELRVKERTADLVEANAGLLREVAKRKHAEDALKDEARRKDDFLAMLGHELRNPLTPIIYANDIQKSISPTDPFAVQAREIISRQVHHLTKIVDDLLDATRIATGRISISKVLLDWAELVRTTVKDYAQEATIRDILMEISAPEDPVWVSGDITRLAQITGNLVSNALKFTDPGGRVTIRVEAHPDRKCASLSVADTGVGVAPEIIRRLFEPFAQADMDLARSRGGLGLGLALAKGLVDLHGGFIQVISEGTGRGAEFIVTLPMAETSETRSPAERDALPDPAPKERLPPPTAYRSEPKNILIIEDNADVAESTRLLLKTKGYSVEIAPDGVSGLRYIKEHAPAVVLCDIGLPGALDGYAVARAVRDDPERASIFLIAITGYGQEKDKTRAINEGFDIHLTKPVNPKALVTILESPNPRGGKLHARKKADE